MWPVGFENVPFDEAITFFREKTSISKEAFEALESVARQRAFTVAGVSQLDVINSVWKDLDKAIANGTTLAQFKKDAGTKLLDAWQGTVQDPAWRMETIFRTNVQSAYAAGRYEEATDPDVLDRRPYWMFDAIMDDRTTEVCSACDGTILPADDPFWDSHIPPLHFNCRSTIITLTDDQAEARGIDKKGPKHEADEGFGDAPEPGDDSAVEPDLTDYPDELAEAYEAKTTEAEPEPDAPDARPETTPDFWEEQYKDFGAAAKPMAHARAAEERGLDEPIDAITKKLEDFPSDATEKTRAYLESAAREGVEVHSLADLVTWAKAQPAESNVDAADIRAASALVTHVASITPRTAIKVKFGKTKNADVLANAKASLAFLNRTVDASIVTRNITVQFDAKRGRWIEATGTILLSKHQPRIFAHEMGHAFEDQNDALLLRSVAFYRKRTDGEPLQKMQDLVPDGDYGADEFTRVDAFRREYVGRQYTNGFGDLVGTELLSMGVEWLAGKDAARFLAEDPEHFYFTLGQLAGTP